MKREKALIGNNERFFMQPPQWVILKTNLNKLINSVANFWILLSALTALGRIFALERRFCSCNQLSMIKGTFVGS